MFDKVSQKLWDIDAYCNNVAQEANFSSKSQNRVVLGGAAPKDVPRISRAD